MPKTNKQVSIDVDVAAYVRKYNLPASEICNSALKDAMSTHQRKLLSRTTVPPLPEKLNGVRAKNKKGDEGAPIQEVPSWRRPGTGNVVS